MFHNHTKWTDDECFYVIAFKGNHRAWLAGPYHTRGRCQ